MKILPLRASITLAFVALAPLESAFALPVTDDYFARADITSPRNNQVFLVCDPLDLVYVNVIATARISYTVTTGNDGAYFGLHSYFFQVWGPGVLTKDEGYVVSSVVNKNQTDVPIEFDYNKSFDLALGIGHYHVALGVYATDGVTGEIFLGASADLLNFDVVLANCNTPDSGSTVLLFGIVLPFFYWILRHREAARSRP